MARHHLLSPTKCCFPMLNFEKKYLIRKQCVSYSVFRHPSLALAHSFTLTGLITIPEKSTIENTIYQLHDQLQNAKIT